MFVKYAGASRRLQPDAPRRHDRDAGRQPVGVRTRHAHDGSRGARRQGLVRARGDAAVPGAVREAGVAGRRAHVHAPPSPANAKPAASTSSISTSRSTTRTATRPSPVPRPRRSRADRGPARRPGRGRHRIGSRHRPRSSRCASHSEGASVVVNDVGVSLDGRGTEEDPAAQVCKEIEALGSEGVPNYDSVTDFDGARASCRPRSTRSARSTSS